MVFILLSNMYITRLSGATTMSLDSIIFGILFFVCFLGVLFIAYIFTLLLGFYMVVCWKSDQ